MKKRLSMVTLVILSLPGSGKHHKIVSMKYLALLRGINVGGKNMIKMSELRDCLSVAGFENVQSYIQSGNIIFETNESNKTSVTTTVEQAIEKDFGLKIPVVLLSKKELETVVHELPKNWNSRPDWKYNYLFLKEPYIIKDVVAAVGQLKPDIEEMVAGKGVLYQSMLLKRFGSTTGGKLAGNPIYKIITIRNHNTVTKLLNMMKG